MPQGFSRTWTEEAYRYRPSRRDSAFLALAACFLAHALLGELIGGKLIQVRGWVMSIGVIPWPVVFVVTDLINEFFGPRAVRRLTLLAIGLIGYAFVLLVICMSIAAAPFSPVNDQAFRAVFGQSLWIIIGSLVAFAISQLIDAMVFVLAKAKTQAKLLWLRALGSTLVSQLIDTFVINAIAFGIPKKITTAQVIELSVTNYGYKVLIAIGTLPLIYLGHAFLESWLAEEHHPATMDPQGDREVQGT